MSNFRRRLMMNFEKKYTPVKYLESTGTQYIDTEFNAPKTVKHKIEVDFQLSEITSNAQTVMGYDLNDVKIDSSGYLQGNTSYPYIGLNRRVVTIEYIPTSGGSSHFITMDTDDNQHAERNSSHWPSNSNITIFTNSKYIKIRMARVKVFSAKIYNDDSLVRDYVPALDEQMIPCLYDKVEDKFYYNKGSGEFLYE